MKLKSFLMGPELQQYVAATWVREPDVLKRLRDETAAMPESGMQIGPEQGQLMFVLIKLLGAKNVLEVGTFTGYSSLAMALALPSDGKIVACDVSEEFTSMARRYWSDADVHHKIDLRIAPATESMTDLLAERGEGSFDLIFIDADKPNYDHYYELGLRHLRVGGAILVDNVFWGGDVADPSASDENSVKLRELNAKMSADARIDLAILPICDGLTIARKRAVDES